MNNIAIFASGSGSNAENIVNFFQSSPNVKITRILSNDPQAGVAQRAERLKIPFQTFTKKELNDEQGVLQLLQEEHIDFIVLAGFLLLFPPCIIKAYPKAIINIHPALLPAYGGKGMYGMHVHEAVVLAQEAQTGITIHYVNEKFDEGEIIFQATCPLSPEDRPEDVAAKIHLLEYEHFPKVIATLISH